VNNKHSPEALADVPLTTDDPSAILRLTRPRAGEARLMVGVEIYPEDNAVVGKVYEAESRLKYASEPAMRTSPEASAPRSPASCANWRRK